MASLYKASVPLHVRKSDRAALSLYRWRETAFSTYSHLERQMCVDGVSGTQASTNADRTGNRHLSN